MTREQFEAKKLSNKTRGAAATLAKSLPKTPVIDIISPSESGDSTQDSISILGEDSEDEIKEEHFKSS